MRQRNENLDYLAARLHGRRSGMAEGPRLRRLCQSRSLPQFSRDILAGESVESARELQRQLLQRLAREIAEIADWVGPRRVSLFGWMLQRFEIESLKLLIRNLLADKPDAQYESDFIHFQCGSMDFQALVAAKTLDELVRRLPRGPLRLSLGMAANRYHDHPRPFFFEASLDRAYYAELLAGAHVLPGEDKELILPLIVQETDLFHLMLIVRGRFGHGLDPPVLMPFLVSGTRITRNRFLAMLNAPDFEAIARASVGFVVDKLPEEPSAEALEKLAWQRFRRLANRTFRRSHIGIAGVIAYVLLRRMEVANLITVSEGIRLGAGETEIREHLIENAELEAANV